MAFGGSFWNFLNFNQNSQIDSMLSDPETTLDKLLADENILSEFKSLNPKLLDYCTDDKIKQLIRYIIEEPPADADKDRGYRFPFVSCEILTADVETILEAFFGRNPNNLRKQSGDSDYSGKADHHEGEEGDSHEERNIELEKDEKESESTNQQETSEEKQGKEEKEEPKKENQEKSEEEKVSGEENNKETETTAVKEDLAGYFFSFLDKKELNVTLVGYFARFLNHLIMRKQNEINQYIWQNPDIVDKFIDHMEQKNIAECLAKLLTIENTSTKTDEYINLKIEKLKKIVNLLSTDAESLDSEVITNLSTCVIEIISKKKSLHSGEEYTKYLASEEFLEPIFENLFRDKALTSNIALIINNLLSNILQGPHTDTDEEHEIHDHDNDSPEKGSPEKKSPEINQDKLHSYLYSKAGDIVEYLDQQPEPKRDSTYGTTQAPLGIARLRLVELVLYVLKLNVNKISSEFALKGVFKVLMRLMVQYEWNNLLHNFIERIFASTLESDSHVVRQKLLQNAKLLDFLVDSSKEVDYTFPNAQQRKVRKGYLGHLTKIAKLLDKLSERDNDIKEYLNNDKWAEFKKNYLQVTLEKDNSDLAKSGRKKSDDYIASHIMHQGVEKSDEKKHHGMDEEDDLNDREYEDKGTPAEFESEDVFSKYEGHYEDDWQKDKNSPEKEENRTKLADIWSMGPADFSMTFKFTGFPEIPKDIEPNAFLELNRKQEIIDIGPQHEPALEQAYFDNAYWARPHHQGHHIDDIMKEFESN